MAVMNFDLFSQVLQVAQICECKVYQQLRPQNWTYAQADVFSLYIYFIIQILYQWTMAILNMASVLSNEVSFVQVTPVGQHSSCQTAEELFCLLKAPHQKTVGL